MSKSLLAPFKYGPKVHYASSDSPSASFYQTFRGFWDGIESYKLKTALQPLPKNLSKEFARHRPPAAGPSAAIAATGSAIILMLLHFEKKCRNVNFEKKFTFRKEM